MRHISICIICIIFAISAQAQFSFGPKAGFNLAKISFSSANFKSSFLPAYYGGAFANYQYNAHWSAQLEVLYAAEGTKEKATNGQGSGHINPAYLQVPLLVQYHLAMGLYAEAGPQIGFLLSIKETYANATNSIKQYYKSTDFRAPFGIGYQFPSTSKLQGLSVNARYSFSFSKINKDIVGGQDLKSQVISIGAYYKIPVKLFGKKK
ncbi:MAG: porin family protein [Chitinophagaceae bacterium]